MKEFKPSINHIEKATGTELQAAMYEFSTATKTFEGEEFLKPLEAELPILANFLIHDNQEVSGCAISIFRRVPINTKTLQKLIRLNKEPNALVTEAIGNIDDNLWSLEIEYELIRCLNFEESEGAAARAFYENVYSIKERKTINTLIKVLHSNNQFTVNNAVNALCTLTKLNLGVYAISRLKQLISDSTNNKLKENIAKTLCWATDNGEELLQLLANDSNEKVRNMASNFLQQPNN
ncbi:hypothetical protein [Urechidicola vernalis]|uniref:HEAT repeat domain-containing protein n=1 Tax=Urechidicola vernalis TaxID=3075600 RepID=A0ABU2Y6W1_9FLAO|nr:hypothetical protein [Urechidicola sp. P050]MDT0553936.1 hypothetical protein [Urechidicola sp. P050]